MQQHTIWSEQCDAAANIETHFGTQNALRYLVTEKFLDFVEAAATDESFREQLPLFAERIKSMFEPSSLEQCLALARQGPPITPGDIERASRHSPEVREQVQESDRTLIVEARRWLLPV